MMALNAQRIQEWQLVSKTGHLQPFMVIANRINDILRWSLSPRVIVTYGLQRLDEAPMVSS